MWSTSRSALTVEDRRLVSGLRGRESKMPVRACCGAPAARRPGEEALLHEERLVHLFECAGILADRRGDGGQSHRAALELLDDGLQDPTVHVVEAELHHVEPLPGLRVH